MVMMAVELLSDRFDGRRGSFMVIMMMAVDLLQ